jgi:hypothetical protein
MRVPQGERGIWPGEPPVAVCDFCAAPLGSGAAVLENDGRHRCHRCGQEAIDSLAAFRRLWDEVVEGMERRYDIVLPETLRVRFVEAAEVARRAGRRVPPAPDDPPVGVLVPAWCDTPTLWLENGAPRLSTMEALVRALTYLWQAGIRVRRRPCPLEIIEGQALYATVDYLTVHGGEALAAYRRRQAEQADTPAARGYRRLAAQGPADPQQLFHPYFTEWLRNPEPMA